MKQTSNGGLESFKAVHLEEDVERCKFHEKRFLVFNFELSLSKAMLPH